MMKLPQFNLSDYITKLKPVCENRQWKWIGGNQNYLRKEH
jgi:hypothetical protein